MDPHKSFLFPDTEICKERLYPLLLFCAPLYFLKPIEDAEDDLSGTEHDIFIKSNLCQAYTPAPLGPNRKRFLRLIHDLKHRKDDYAAQLAALTMASMSIPKGEKTGESRSQIISSLLGGETVPVGTRETELWQARLILAIAELLDQEEETLQRNMQLLDTQELEMFRSLTGEDDSGEDPFAEIDIIAARLESARPRESRLRFDAWLKMMRTGTIPGVTYWIASTQLAADQVFNTFERISDSPALPVLEVPLPARIEASPVYVARRVDAFLDKAATARHAISKELIRLSRATVTTPAKREDLLPGEYKYLNEWEALIDEHFPEHSHGRTSLIFHLLPDHRLTEMLSLHDSGHRAGNAHGLLGVLR